MGQGALPALEPHNIDEVLELRAGVPLIVKGHVVELDVTHVFGYAHSLWATARRPRRTKDITKTQVIGYKRRYLCGDRTAAADFLRLHRALLARVVLLVKEKFAAPADDVLAEIKWYASTRFGDFARSACSFGEWLAKSVPQVARELKLRVSKMAWLMPSSSRTNNVRAIADAAERREDLGLPLEYMGRVVECPIEERAQIAKRLACTLGSAAPKTHRDVRLHHELSYVERFRLGDETAGWEYVHLNEALVHTLVKKASKQLPPNDLPPEDLFSEGQVGAFKAFTRWDPAVATFSTYAFNWVRHHIQSAAASGGSTISVRQELHLSLWRARKDGRKMTPSEAALDQIKAITSIDEMMVDDEGKPHARRSAILLSDDDVESNVARMDAQWKIGECVQDALRELPERERKIILERYFGDADSDSTLERIGREQGVSRERIRQIEVSARKRLEISVLERFGSASEVLAAIGGV